MNKTLSFLAGFLLAGSALAQTPTSSLPAAAANATGYSAVCAQPGTSGSVRLCAPPNLGALASGTTTDGIPEGTNNRYYTDARAAAAGPQPSNATPAALGTASAGTSNLYRRADAVIAHGDQSGLNATTVEHSTGQIANFTGAAAAAAPVQSVAGRTGAVTLAAADVAGAVDTSTAQTVGGAKTFSSLITAPAGLTTAGTFLRYRIITPGGAMSQTTEAIEAPALSASTTYTAAASTESAPNTPLGSLAYFWAAASAGAPRTLLNFRVGTGVGSNEAAVYFYPGAQTEIYSPSLIRQYINNSLRTTLTSAGFTVVGTTNTVLGSDGTVTAGVSIKDSATSDARSVYLSNRTWSPTLSGSTTAGSPTTNTTTGQYTRIGSQVTGVLNLGGLTAGGAAGDVRISLPVTAGPTPTAMAVLYSNVSFPTLGAGLGNITGIVLYIPANSTFGVLMYTKSTGAVGAVQWADLTAGSSSFAMSITYLVP